MEQDLTEILTVDRNDCISDISVDLPDLLGTYILVKWMEIVSAKLAIDTIDENYITVGKSIDIQHMGMAKKVTKSLFVQNLSRKKRKN